MDRVFSYSRMPDGSYGFSAVSLSYEDCETLRLSLYDAPDAARLQGELGKLKSENEQLRADRQHFYDLAGELEKKVANLTEINKQFDAFSFRLWKERDAARQDRDAEAAVNQGANAEVKRLGEVARRYLGERNEARAQVNALDERLEKMTRHHDRAATEWERERDEAKAELDEANKQLGESQLDRINARKEAQAATRNHRLLEVEYAQLAKEYNELVAEKYELNAKLKAENNVAVHRLNITERQREEIAGLKAKLEQMEKTVPLVEVFGGNIVRHCCHTASGPEVRFECLGCTDIKVTGYAKFRVQRVTAPSH